jgi:hypothetical protein
LADTEELEPVRHAQNANRPEAHGGEQDHALDERLHERLDVEGEEQAADGAQDERAED